MELNKYHKEELQLLLLTVMDSWRTENGNKKEAVLKAWIDRIRYALKDKS